MSKHLWLFPQILAPILEKLYRVLALKVALYGREQNSDETLDLRIFMGDGLLRNYSDEFACGGGNAKL